MKTFLILGLIFLSWHYSFSQCDPKHAYVNGIDATEYDGNGAVYASIVFPGQNGYWYYESENGEYTGGGVIDNVGWADVPAGTYYAEVGFSFLFEGEFTECVYSETIIVGQPSCSTADLNVDFAVNASDLLLFTPAFGCAFNCGAGDLNDDNAVNISDMLMFLAEYGSSCLSP